MGNLVVVGVDGSSSSLSAVEAAVGEAQRRRAELRVVHAFSWPVRPMYAQLDQSPLNRLVHEAAQHAQSVAPEVEVTEAVVTGDAVAVLEAESRAADLVVVGSRGGWLHRHAAGINGGVPGRPRPVSGDGGP